MSKIESSNVSTAPAGKPQTLPFLLTSQQGEAARTLLSYVVSLGLPDPDAQLVAVVVAIRAARGGVGNLTGTDLSALRLSDARGAVDALRALGWQVDDALFDGDDPATPVPVTVPDLAREADHPLPFGKNVRSRVSGWTTRALSAKPVKKLPPAARLAGLFLAAHSTSELHGQIPPDLPEACRAALPDLLRKGFLAELSEGRCRLDPAVRHLSGLRRPTEEERAAEPAKAEGKTVPPRMPDFQFDAAAWSAWKTAATPALRRHVETVEYCAMCALEPGRVAEAFMGRVRPQFFPKWIKDAYGDWKDSHPDRGPQAAEFTVAFRAEHGHGPSYNQLCSGMGWGVNRSVRGFIVQRLLANEWLMDTSPVPWTLRPGRAAQDQGIALPKARSSTVAAHVGP
ncbi:hypothetical protein ACFWWC_19040 [Streptomyces sp. NPDC058642]|uniref:hypothetical protein n=1 Tax=Streptomyces sp. NPDC058642 TaxID=3346572 RepID=UPI00365D0219